MCPTFAKTLADNTDGGPTSPTIPYPKSLILHVVGHPVLKAVGQSCCPSVPAVHYIGFRDDRYWNAFRIWGGPRIIHRWWDKRAMRDIGPDDIVIFADGDWTQEPKPFNAPDIDEATERG